MTEPKIILDQDGVRRALTRIAFEIVEKNIEKKSGRRTRTRDQSPDDENGDCT